MRTSGRNARVVTDRSPTTSPILDRAVTLAPGMLLCIASSRRWEVSWLGYTPLSHRTRLARPLSNDRVTALMPNIRHFLQMIGRLINLVSIKIMQPLMFCKTIAFKLLFYKIPRKTKYYSTLKSHYNYIHFV